MTTLQDLAISIRTVAGTRSWDMAIAGDRMAFPLAGILSRWGIGILTPSWARGYSLVLSLGDGCPITMAGGFFSRDSDGFGIPGGQTKEFPILMRNRVRLQWREEEQHA